MPASVSFSIMNFTLLFPLVISPYSAFVPRHIWLIQTLECHQSAPLFIIEQK